MAGHRRYEVLDACRGIAACLVACFHFGMMYNHGLGQFVPNGFLAVDFFFVLSGFVIDRSYTPRLHAGMGIGSFMEGRILRLYPLYLFGQGLGVLRQIAGIIVNEPRALSSLKVGLAAAFGFLMLPSPFAGRHLFALNSPSWSIFLELLANVVFAAGAFRLGLRALFVIAIVSAVALGASVVWAGQITDFGQTWLHLPGGILRVTFSFAVGVLISRAVRTPPRLTDWSFLLICALAAALLIAQADASTSISNGYGLFFIVFISPMIVYGGARYDCVKLKRVCAYLGNISYPLYMIHPFLIDPFRFLVRKFSLSAGVATLIYLVAAVVVATIALYCLDQPVRRFLSSWLRVRQSAPPQVVINIP